MKASIIAAIVVTSVPTFGTIAHAGCDRPAMPRLNITSTDKRIQLVWEPTTRYVDLAIRRSSNKSVVTNITGGLEDKRDFTQFNLESDTSYDVDFTARTEPGTQGCIALPVVSLTVKTKTTCEAQPLTPPRISEIRAGGSQLSFRFDQTDPTAFYAKIEVRQTTETSGTTERPVDRVVNAQQVTTGAGVNAAIVPGLGRGNYEITVWAIDPQQRCISVATKATAKISLASAPVNDPMATLKNMGLDYSVDANAIRGWLETPQFTPYPAILGALNTLLNGKRFREPIYMDVLVANYVDAVNYREPHQAGEVDLDKLKAAAIKAHLERYGVAVADFQTMLN